MPAVPIQPYLALALQMPTHPVAGLSGRDAIRLQIQRSIAGLGESLAAATSSLGERHGLPVRLVVLPEYVLTGAPGAGGFADWRNSACLEINGPEYAALATIASQCGAYLAGNAYEVDAHFPELYFQCSFVISPGGDVILRYRRLISLYSPSPYDVWERYLNLYGLAGVYPVADTDIGRIAAIASEEILYPEIARCVVMRGAEILVHSTSEMGSPRTTAKELARRARASENLAYVVSANTAGVPGTDLPSRSSTGMSKVVDFNGRIIAEAAPGGASIEAHGIVDVTGLRARRQHTGLANSLSRLPLQAFAASYAGITGRAANELRSAGGTSRAYLQKLQVETIERLRKTRAI